MNKLKSYCLLVVLLAASAFLAPPQAQSDSQALEDHMAEVRRKVTEKRDSAMSTLLVMTNEQADAFKPLKKAYEKELKQIDKKDRDLIREFSAIFDQLTAKSASDVGKRFFDLERERLALQEKYMKLISDAVSPVIAVQFVQLQRRFEAQFENERMKYSPLAE